MPYGRDLGKYINGKKKAANLLFSVRGETKSLRELIILQIGKLRDIQKGSVQFNFSLLHVWRFSKRKPTLK